MNYFRFIAVVLAFLTACTPTYAQWQVPNHSVPTGRGVGVMGFGSAAPGAAGLPFVSNGPNSDPSFQPIGRTKLPVGITNFYANSSATGCGGGGCLETNDGLTVLTAKKTMLGALYGVLNGYDFTCTVAGQAIAKINLLANEVNAAGAHFGPHDYAGACAGSSVTVDLGGFTLQNDSASTPPLAVFFTAAFQVQNGTIANSAGTCISITENGTLRAAASVTYNCLTGVQLKSGGGITFLNNFTNAYAGTGGTGVFIDAEDGTTVTFGAGVTVTCSASPVYQAFMVASKGGRIVLNSPSWSGCGSVGGLKYITTDGSSITGGAASLPGAGFIETSGATTDGNPVRVSAGGTNSAGPGVFSALPACASVTFGTLSTVTDSTVNTWGSVIAGGGVFPVLAYCNATNWTVAGK